VRLGLIVEQLLAPVPGGTGRYTRELAAALALAAGPDDHIGAVVARHADTAPALVAGIAAPSRLLLPAPALARAWQRGLPPRVRGFDVVHAPTPLAPPAGRRLVVTVHDAVPWTHPETLTDHGARWHRAIIERVVRAGAVIVTPTRAVADVLADVLPALAAERLHVLGGGVSPALLAEVGAEESAAVLRDLGVPDRFLLTVATLEPRKRLDVAIDALAQLGADAPTLVVVGQAGWGEVSPADLAARAGLAPDKLLLLGRRSDAELRVLLRRARALVMPSAAEGFGLPVAEAMALDTAVICTAIPALEEVAGGAALTVPVGDSGALAEAIRAVSTDDALVESLRSRGREQAARHQWPAVAARAWRLYRSMLG
jgi:glycosyltransferase involved in cell wall biosynthesis